MHGVKEKKKTKNKQDHILRKLKFRITHLKKNSETAGETVPNEALLFLMPSDKLLYDPRPGTENVCKKKKKMRILTELE